MDDGLGLLGGTLLVTPLLGADGEIYAVAQGPVTVGGFSAQGAGQTVTVYTHLGTGIDPIAVGNSVRMVGWRTIAPGPIVADVLRNRPAGAPGGVGVAYLYQGVVSQVSSNLLNSAPAWNIGGVD